MRLDFDIDGERKTVHQVDIVADPIDEHNPFENAFRATATALKTEKQACANLNLATARTWKIINPPAKTGLANQSVTNSYPATNAVPFASPNAWWRKWARFVDHHVWVTPLDENENFAAGDFPNQSLADRGLSTWIAADRAIQHTDIVLWYTFGHTHIPRPEDYPVMPAAYIGFLLKPNGFSSGIRRTMFRRQLRRPTLAAMEAASPCEATAAVRAGGRWNATRVHLEASALLPYSCQNT